MGDENRMIRRGGIQILTRELAPFRRLGVVVLESQHPFTWRSLGGALSNRFLDCVDGAQITVHFAQMLASRRGGMRVCIDETGHDRIATGVDHAAA